MKAVTWLELELRSRACQFYLHLQTSTQQANRFLLDSMVLITQRFPFVNMKNLSHIAWSMSPNELVASVLFNDSPLISLMSQLKLIYDIKTFPKVKTNCGQSVPKDNHRDESEPKG